MLLRPLRLLRLIRPKRPLTLVRLLEPVQLTGPNALGLMANLKQTQDVN
jgi:hypothetical protein